ncbi:MULTISPECIES: histidinol-phosphate transaminase [unclassified Curtobacterium]|uniref:histidinol-phosphate transaminase n=1 Tax=unclassified Curtobacterium TaxID=257496 RepID=UPI0008DC77AE|nr:MULTISPECIES: histidinol-phosphate transaminase [unclassified Curtobacterium]OIH98893.1 histidinol-phosphate transaminase [Curtobacterium sp. MCBA15_003]OII14573.1 histidinol-phosphate transaminase [Curtobacterium sp. MCBA15_009]OII31242.1 histidinol-phosphate transaminase [Curtobacterium sp. MMLR14_006]
MAFTLDDLPIRDDLRGQSPYGAPQKHVRVQLNVNENTHPVPDAVAEDILASIRQALATVNRYPDREFTELRRSLADYLGHDLTVDQLWAANGSNEVLQQLLQAFGGPGRSVLGFPPTYSMHSILAAGTGTRWIPAQRDDEFRTSPETVVAAIEAHQPDIVFLCGPNNPTGTPLPIETIEAAYAATDGIVMVDEAYAEFMPSDAPSALSLLPGRPRLVVSRTMSKAFAFAGARVGYLAADPAVVDALRLVRLPYHLSALTQAAAVAALRHAPAMLAMVDDIKEQRDRMVTELQAMGYRTYETWSNFVLFGGVADPHAAFEALLDQDVIVRDLGIPNHLRVSAGTAEETTAFLDAMRRVAAVQPPVRVDA